MGTPKYLISACLCGEYCRYDGGTFDYPALQKLAEDGLALPYCPEHCGGLPIPRKPCEIVGEQVLAADGTDCTIEYTRGAEGALALCQQHGITAAILKESSPSCGSHLIYDGTHTGRKIPGMGLTARLLSEHGIELFTEKELPDEIK